MWCWCRRRIVLRRGCVVYEWIVGWWIPFALAALAAHECVSSDNESETERTDSDAGCPLPRRPELIEAAVKANLLIELSGLTNAALRRLHEQRPTAVGDHRIDDRVPIGTFTRVDRIRSEFEGSERVVSK